MLVTAGRGPVLLSRRDLEMRHSVFSCLSTTLGEATAVFAACSSEPSQKTPIRPARSRFHTRSDKVQPCLLERWCGATRPTDGCSHTTRTEPSSDGPRSPNLTANPKAAPSSRETPVPHHIVHWQEDGHLRSAQWAASSQHSLPKTIVIARDDLSATQALRLITQNQAILWRGDYRNARQLLTAMARRLTRRRTTRQDATPAAIFHQHRQAKAHRAHLLSRVLIELGPEHTLDLPHAPDVSQAYQQAHDPTNDQVTWPHPPDLCPQCGCPRASTSNNPNLPAAPVEPSQLHAPTGDHVDLPHEPDASLAYRSIPNPTGDLPHDSTGDHAGLPRSPDASHAYQSVPRPVGDLSRGSASDHVARSRVPNGCLMCGCSRGSASDSPDFSAASVGSGQAHGSTGDHAGLPHAPDASHACQPFLGPACVLAGGLNGPDGDLNDLNDPNGDPNDPHGPAGGPNGPAGERPSLPRGAAGDHRILPLRELLGMLGAYQWRVRGVRVPALGATIHPHYGVFAPTRQEYIDLVAGVPWPRVGTAFDIGTGTGVLAVLLAQRGASRVVATDVALRAVLCARDNVRRLGLGDRVCVEHQDLFPRGRADLIVCNPPWLPAEPTSSLDAAVYDPGAGMLRRFVRGVPHHLIPGGEAWLILSDLAERLGLRDEPTGMFAEAGLVVAGRHNIRPRHRTRRRGDPLGEHRAAEIVSLWRLRVG